MIVHSLIQFGVEELKSFHAGDCATCNQLRRGLKEALMYALLSSTWHRQSEMTTHSRVRNAEINLTYALKDFREHRRVGHAVNHFVPPWTADVRNAS